MPEIPQRQPEIPKSLFEVQQDMLGGEKEILQEAMKKPSFMKRAIAGGLVFLFFLGAGAGKALASEAGEVLTDWGKDILKSGVGQKGDESKSRTETQRDLENFKIEYVRDLKAEANEARMALEYLLLELKDQKNERDFDPNNVWTREKEDFEDKYSKGRDALLDGDPTDEQKLAFNKMWGSLKQKLLAPWQSGQKQKSLAGGKKNFEDNFETNLAKLESLMQSVFSQTKFGQEDKAFRAFAKAVADLFPELVQTEGFRDWVSNWTSTFQSFSTGKQRELDRVIASGAEDLAAVKTQGKEERTDITTDAIQGAIDSIKIEF